MMIEVSIKERAQAAYRESCETAEKQMKEAEAARRLEREESLKNKIERVLGITDGIRFEHDGDSSCALLFELSEVEFRFRKWERLSAEFWAYPHLPSVPNTDEYEDWHENTLNKSFPQGRHITSWADLGALLSDLDAYGPIEIKPWPARMSSPADDAPITLQKSITRVSCMTMGEANTSQRPFKIISGVVVDGDACVIVEYTDVSIVAQTWQNTVSTILDLFAGGAGQDSPEYHAACVEAALVGVQPKHFPLGTVGEALAAKAAAES